MMGNSMFLERRLLTLCVAVVCLSAGRAAAQEAAEEPSVALPWVAEKEVGVQGLQIQALEKLFHCRALFDLHDGHDPGFARDC